MLIKVLALICPIMLFIFKYILPSLAEEAFANRKRMRGQIKIELIHFPVDLLFVAISYIIPKIIEGVTQLLEIDAQTGEFMAEYYELIGRIVIYGAESFFIILLVPFFVFITKFAENNYFEKKKRWIAQAGACYLIAVWLIWISIFRI